MASRPPEERNQDATVYVGNVDERVTEGLLWELMLQAGPVVNVHLPKDRVTQSHQGYGFVEYMTEEDAEYAIKIMNMIKLFGKPIRVNKATSDRKNLDVGANLFIGNLDPDVDEKLLYDTFSAFGVIVQTPKVARDPDVGNSKGYGFVSFDNFESSDAAIEAMNGQFLMNKPITVSYAFKKDGKGERHGSAAERLLASESRKNAPAHMPNRMFVGEIPTRPGTGPAPAMPVALPPVPVAAPIAPVQPFMSRPPQPPPFGFQGPPGGLQPPPQGGPPAGFPMQPPPFGRPPGPPPPFGGNFPPPQQYPPQQWGAGR
ncbi:Splicing factor 3B subunit 4 [Rhizophlyctis rosea]|nr:Splicing factor 3B subunit 4 [Rhizophlyctis rosea]